MKFKTIIVKFKTISYNDFYKYMIFPNETDKKYFKFKTIGFEFKTIARKFKTIMCKSKTTVRKFKTIIRQLKTIPVQI